MISLFWARKGNTGYVGSSLEVFRARRRICNIFPWNEIVQTFAEVSSTDNDIRFGKTEQQLKEEREAITDERRIVSESKLT